MSSFCRTDLEEVICVHHLQHLSFGVVSLMQVKLIIIALRGGCPRGVMDGEMHDRVIDFMVLGSTE